jgi:S-formylglutathione hydrolase
MGGHGALTLAMRHPGRWLSVSAFAPICHPSASDWGRPQMKAYGVDPVAHDATLLMRDRGLDAPLLIDTGGADQFRDRLGTAAFAAAALARGGDIAIRQQAGYDHSYFFVASFAADHVAFHAEHLA